MDSAREITALFPTICGILVSILRGADTFLMEFSSKALHLRKLERPSFFAP